MGCFPPKSKLAESSEYASPVNLKQNASSSPNSKGKA